MGSIVNVNCEEIFIVPYSTKVLTEIGNNECRFFCASGVRVQ
jgi:hypothetical protein